MIYALLLVAAVFYGAALLAAMSASQGADEAEQDFFASPSVSADSVSATDAVEPRGRWPRGTAGPILAEGSREVPMASFRLRYLAKKDESVALNWEEEKVNDASTRL